jgi:hypothetical protein
LISKKINVLKDYVTYKPDCAGRYATIEQYGDLDWKRRPLALKKKLPSNFHLPRLHLPEEL